MHEPTDLKFCREVKHQKIFNTCPGFFQSLDQGPDGALKIIFLKYGLNFGMDKPRELKFCRGVKHLKIFDICSGFTEIWTMGLEWGLENCFS